MFVLYTIGFVLALWVLAHALGASWSGGRDTVAENIKEDKQMEWDL